MSILGLSAQFGESGTPECRARHAPGGPGSSCAAPGLVVAIDWSGRARGEQRYLWTAEARCDRLLRLGDGRRRAEVEDHLVSLAGAEPRLVVGIDFSFSLPGWWMRQQGFSDPAELWRAAAEWGERWLQECRPPFWGRPSRKRPLVDDPRRPPLRLTEQLTPPVAGLRPKSTFQVGGAGAPGTGSIRGMPMLARLRRAGFAIWPFDPPHWPVALEIWPRQLTGPVRKSDPAARRRYLEALARARPGGLESPELFALATSSEDALDAAVAALALGSGLRSLDDLPTSLPPEAGLEGWIWAPPPDGVTLAAGGGEHTNRSATRVARAARRPPSGRSS